MKQVFFEGKVYDVGFRENNTTRSLAYVWGPGDDRNPSEEFAELAESVGAESVYTLRGEYPELDKAFDKMNREIVAEKRKVLRAVLKALGEEDVKDSFSRKAGCKCGCSPGFILKGYQKGMLMYVEEQRTD